MTIERRFIPNKTTSGMKIEKRADGGSTIFGYAACFFDPGDAGTEYALYPGVRERVMPGAFDRCMRDKQDVRGLFNHSPDFLLGRCSAGTMRLSVDRRGLRYEIDLPDTQAGRDVAESIRRGDLTGSSFSFDVVSQRFTYGQMADSGSDVEDNIRELLDVNLFDVGPVSFPAYSSTEVGIRALGDLAEVRCACERNRTEPRGVIRYNNTPLIDDDNWDADSALQRVKAWASEGDRMNMRKYSRAFTWHDGSSTADGHRGLHHDVRDGKLMVHRGAVQRYMRMLDDDGAGIPEEDVAAARSHLQRHAGAWDDPDADDDETDEEMDGDESERAARMASMRMRLRLAEAG